MARVHERHPNNYLPKRLRAGDVTRSYTLCKRWMPEYRVFEGWQKDITCLNCQKRRERLVMVHRVHSKVTGTVSTKKFRAARFTLCKKYASSLLVYDQWMDGVTCLKCKQQAYVDYMS